MAENNFQQFLDEFELPQSVVDKLREVNVRSVKELAASETSTIRNLVDHPVLNTILPILQQHSDEISRAKDPHQHALDLLHHRADVEDEEISSSNIPTDGNQMPSVNDTPSTSTFTATAATKQTNQIVNLNQSLSAEDEEEISEQETFQRFLKEFGFPQDVGDKLRNDEQTTTRTGFLTKFLFRNKDKKDLFLEALKKETTTVAKEANKQYSEWRKFLLKYAKMSEEVRESETIEQEGKNRGMRLEENAHHTMSICNMLFEASSEEVIKTVATCFVQGGISLTNISLSQSDVQAVARVITATPSVKVLNLSFCSMDSDKFAVIREAIERMSGKIGVMDIGYNVLTGVDDVIPMLHKIETELWMEDSFVDDSRSANNEEKNHLQEVLDQLENTHRMSTPYERLTPGVRPNYSVFSEQLEDLS